ncbi:MAG: FKBP-type peptidyl-prolyl cis-trans isomerase [Alphaproteobacteria bacterium]|nr:FKBP-type peptidyl-prolyl cis-trans isomerase [Alphaproteobacteria bacterium]
MKKFLSLAAIFGALTMTACNSNVSAQNGDTVIIDFAGYLDGVQFPGGTAQAFPLILGSGQFVPGFEEQLIGATKGETRDVNITFPTNYYPELAGKSVVFKVTVQDIKSK